MGLRKDAAGAADRALMGAQECFLPVTPSPLRSELTDCAPLALNRPAFGFVRVMVSLRLAIARLKISR